MKKMTIFRFIRDPRNFGKILGKETLRVVNTHESFTGVGENGTINKEEFKKLADVLEPYNEGINIT